MSILGIMGQVLLSADDNTREFLPSLAIDVRERIAKYAVIPVDLTDDSPVVIGMNGIDANVLIAIIKCGDGYVAELTTEQGKEAELSASGPLVLISDSDPVTAITLTRAASQATSVNLFIGQMA